MKKNHIFFWYVCRELLLYFSIAFLFFFIVFLVNQVLLFVDIILEKHVPVSKVCLLIYYNLPFIIAQSAPFATLVGFLMCIGRMVSDNEILIYQALGNSFFQLILAAVFMGLSISFVSFLVNDYLIPWGTVSNNELTNEIARSIPEMELEPYSIKRLEKNIIVFGDVNDKDISEIVFFNSMEDGEQRIITADTASMKKSDCDDILFQMNMENVNIFTMDKKTNGSIDFMHAESSTMNLYSSSLTQALSSGIQDPKEMPSITLKAEINEMKKNESNKMILNFYELEFFKRFSLPFASIFFAFLSIPLSILFGKTNGQTIGLIIGIILSVVFWAMLIVGQKLCIQNGFNSFIMMWFPDIFIGFLALIFSLFLARK